MKNFFIKKALNISILFLYLFSFSLCAEDTIYLNSVGCILADKKDQDHEIISFEYTEGYYRAIHASYSYTVSDSVKLRYLGDSSKDVFMVCYINPSFSEIADSSHSTLKYHIPCTMANEKIRRLSEGTYCLEIVKKLIGDITTANYCTNSYTFKITKSTNIPNLNVFGFSSEQNGCVTKSDKITLLATVGNSMSISEDYNNLGIGLLNTEYILDDKIILNCKIEGDIGVNSNDKIICSIPNSVPKGIYTVYHSSELLNSYECPINLINDFNSLNFQGDIKRLYIIDEVKNDKVATLIDINFNEPSFVPGQFNLTFSLNTTDESRLNYDDINNQDLGIKLVDYNENIINTTCNLVISDDNKSIFYLICNAIDYKNDVRYSLFIREDFEIGTDQSETVCSVDDYTVYSKIKISSNEYDFLIIFENESTNLDCHQRNNGFYLYTISSIRNICGSCGSNCVSCQNICNKCWEGFELNGNVCELVSDTISYDRFQEFQNLYTYEDTCNSNKQLFTLIFNYNINKGDNYAIDSITNININAKNNNNNNYRLNCSIEVNPTYIQSEQYFGYCKNDTCNLSAYINCFLSEQSPNGEYEIEGNLNSNIGLLINKAQNYFNGKLIVKYTEFKLESSVNENNIEVLYSGSNSDYKTIYVCPNNFISLSNCNYLTNCNLLFYNETSYESIYNCTKEVYDSFLNNKCEDFNYIVIKDDCGNYINNSITFQYCLKNYSNDDSSYYESEIDDYSKYSDDDSSRIPFINLFMIFWVLLIAL